MIPSIFWKWAAIEELKIDIRYCIKDLYPEACQVELFKNGQSVFLASGYLTEEECVYRCLEGYFGKKITSTPPVKKELE